jgi:hypothetical protein
MKANVIDLKKIKAYREKTFRLVANLKLKSKIGALNFVNERGFIFFWPIQGITFPSLWAAVAGDRVVPAFHDDPAHVTWGWKDDMLDKKKWYYAKVLRNKSTIISLELAPYFCALTKSYGDPELDCRFLFEQGRISRPAQIIYQALISEGPIDTFNLRQKIHMVGKEFNGQFDRGLVELQRNFKILPVGVAQTGRWGYSFIFDLTYRHYPKIAEQAVDITPETAFQKLTETYFKSVGAATARDVRRIFGWPELRVETVLQQLVNDGYLCGGCRMGKQTEDCFILSELKE